ncbi:wax ester/triacylglycerol synthase family O-acyltransferase [Umezawaea sp. Da 62-37]|uniref:wax ester/triacylglycerol synthase family O-acyltransferase n=1 Tax=Umezawaea sp. Da 62-37 TaxID=3075927 RepID=UPI0028F72A7D|nr:wax ester/triacylglycerol synthase family O-acyltransferase [Umezawaea sp. Da 62-37]WNV84810.1 wax ester/triacylglycerol synthase family O-acyltransferase [Umezawaea sp. Da 62-37]
MDRLSPLDAAFLDVEDGDPHASLAMASIAVVEGPPPDHAHFTAVIAARLRPVRRTRQKVRRLPWDLGLPLWVNDPDFDLGYHLRRTALPAPGGEVELTDLIGRIMDERLDRDRPLWECWVVEGLADGRWAMLFKVHHCLVDGVGGTALYSAVFTDEPVSAQDVPPQEQSPSMLRLLLGAVGDLATSPLRQAQLVLRFSFLVAGHATGAVKGLAALAGVITPAGPSSLSGPLGKPRRYRVARASLTDIARVGKSFGVTVNDVVLAAITIGFRALLLDRGELPAADTVRTMVPVSVRAHERSTSVDNRLSVLMPFLPVDLVDPLEVLTAVHERMAALKESGASEAGQAVVALAEQEPFAPLSWGIRFAAGLPQRTVVTVTTNVPGPRDVVHLFGKRVVEILPFVPIAARLRTGVAAMTYRDRLAIGITADYDSTPDIDLLAKTIEQALAGLVALQRFEESDGR